MTTLTLREIAHNDVWRRIGFTLFALFLYRLLYSIPLPSIDYEALKQFSSQYGELLGLLDRRLSRISLLTLGLMPYVSAYVLVELFSLFVPPLKRLRTGDFAGRSRLKTYALFLTVILGGIQAYGIVEGLSTLKSWQGLPLLPLHGPSDYILPVATLMAGVFILIFLAEMITRHGVAHGISTLIAAGTIYELAGQVVRGYRTNVELGAFSPGGYLLLVTVPLLIVILLSVLFLKSRRPVLFEHPLIAHPVPYFQFNMVPSGLQGIEWGLPIASLLSLAVWSMEGVQFTWTYLLAQAALGVFLSFPVAALFLHWKGRVAQLANMGWTPSKKAGDRVHRQLLAYNVPWVLFVGGMFLLPEVLIRQLDAPYYFDALSLLVATAVVLDALDRIKKSPSGKMLRVAEIHDVYYVTMIKNHLEAEGIRAHLQGYNHRSLLYFFGPYIEISVLVPEGDRERTEEIIERFHGGIGLVRGRVAPDGGGT